MNKINNKLELNKEGIREDFCPPCLALIPLAFAGAGTSVSATMCAEEKDKHYKDKQRTKNILFWSSYQKKLYQGLIMYSYENKYHYI